VRGRQGTATFGSRAAIAIACLIVGSSSWAAEGDQWKSTDRSMDELLGSGYELVTVIPAGHDFTYFLKSHSKVARCRETTTIGTPMTMMPLPPAPGTHGIQPMPVDMPEPEMTTNVECFELVRPK
jgi:hypothetical protein